MPHTQPDVLQNNVVMMAIMEPSLPHIEQSTHSHYMWTLDKQTKRQMGQSKNIVSLPTRSGDKGIEIKYVTRSS